MIPKNRENRKMHVNLACPGCGMNLADRASAGFVKQGDTYCCKGCAEGTGCTCKNAIAARKINYVRPGDIGQRNPENSLHDHNQNEEVDTSGHWFGNRRETKKAPARQQNRGQRLSTGAKRARSRSEERPSTREQARGRSEQRGKLNRRLNRSATGDRVAKTGTKSKRGS